MKAMFQSHTVEDAASPALLSERTRWDCLNSMERLVLACLSDRDAPASAYQLINDIPRRAGRGVAPTTVYRALALLQFRGLVKQLSQRGAFALCDHSGQADHCNVLFVCVTCGGVSSISDPRFHALISEGASRPSFEVRAKAAEIEGVCQGCQAANVPSAAPQSFQVGSRHVHPKTSSSSLPIDE